MKTIKDAYKELKGDLGNTQYHYNEDRHVYYRAGMSPCEYTTFENHQNENQYQYICTVEEFNRYGQTPERMIEIQAALADSIKTRKDKMIPFDLEKALAGDKVVTRGGHVATQFHVFDVNSDDICFGAVVDGKLRTWFVDGHFSGNQDQLDSLDLFMEPIVVLEDKGLYLFDINNKTELVGEAYFTEIGDCWMITNIRVNRSYQASKCTNIIRLVKESNDEQIQ